MPYSSTPILDSGQFRTCYESFQYFCSLWNKNSSELHYFSLGHHSNRYRIFHGVPNMNCVQNYTVRNYSDISYISHYPNFHILYAVGGKTYMGTLRNLKSVIPHYLTTENFVTPNDLIYPGCVNCNGLPRHQQITSMEWWSTCSMEKWDQGIQT